MAADDDEDVQRLYSWVRIFGAVTLIVTVALTVLGVIILPVFVPDYEVSEGMVFLIIASLSTSALALVNVQVVLRRNGNGH